MVGRQSPERGFEARRLDCRAGKDTKNRNPQLDYCFAGGPDRNVSRADYRVHQAVMKKNLAMGVRVLMLACAWMVLSLAVAQRVLGAPQAGEPEKQDTEKTSGRRRDSQGEKRQQEKTLARFQ